MLSENKSFPRYFPILCNQSSGLISFDLQQANMNAHIVDSKGEKQKRKEDGSRNSSYFTTPTIDLHAKLLIKNYY